MSESKKWKLLVFIVASEKLSLYYEMDFEVVKTHFINKVLEAIEIPKGFNLNRMKENDKNPEKGSIKK